MTLEHLLLCLYHLLSKVSSEQLNPLVVLKSLLSTADVSDGRPGGVCHGVTCTFESRSLLLGDNDDFEDLEGRRAKHWQQ